MIWKRGDWSSATRTSARQRWVVRHSGINFDGGDAKADGLPYGH
jgi:hypothetical protein